MYDETTLQIQDMSRYSLTNQVTKQHKDPLQLVPTAPIGGVRTTLTMPPGGGGQRPVGLCLCHSFDCVSGVQVQQIQSCGCTTTHVGDGGGSQTKKSCHYY